MKLTREQVQWIRQYINDSGITMQTLRDDVADHLMCVIEMDHEEEKTFEIAFRDAVQELAPNGLAEMQKETILLLNSNKILRMKKVMYFIGLVSSVSIGLGWLFSLLHWPGGWQLFNYGFLALLLIFAPMLAMDHYKKSIRKALPEKFKVLLGIVSALIVGTAVAFKIVHLPGADILLIIGMLMFIFGFLPFLFFTMYRKSVEESHYIDTDR